MIPKEIMTPLQITEPKVEIQSSQKKLTKSELKQNKQSKLNSFLYQIETQPTQVPQLKHSKSLPDLQEQNDKINISTSPSPPISNNSKKKRSTSVVTLNESVTKNIPPKKGFFSFLSNNKQSKKTNEKVDEIINKPKIDEQPKKYKKIKVLKTTIPNEKIIRSPTDKKKKIVGLENTRPSVIFSDKTKQKSPIQKKSINDKQIQLKLNKNGSPSSNDSQSPVERRHTNLRNPIIEPNHKSSNESGKKGIKQHNKNTKLMHQDNEYVAPRTSTTIHENKTKSKSLKTDKKISSQKSNDIKDIKSEDITMKKQKNRLIDSGGGTSGGVVDGRNDIGDNGSSNYDHLEFKKNNESPDPWDLVAKHRQHTATISKSNNIKISSTIAPPQQIGVSLVDERNFQTRQIEKLNKPKTMREMKKNHMEVMINQRESNALNLRKKGNDSDTDTEA